MTKLERTIRQVSDLRDFYLKIKKAKEAMKDAPAGSVAREILEQHRSCR